MAEPPRPHGRELGWGGGGEVRHTFRAHTHTLTQTLTACSLKFPQSVVCSAHTIPQGRGLPGISFTKNQHCCLFPLSGLEATLMSHTT